MVELVHCISAKDSEALEAINTMCPHLRVIKLNGGTLLDSFGRDDISPKELQSLLSGRFAKVSKLLN